MIPTEILKHEHQVILMVLGAAEREASSIAAGHAVDVDRVAAMVDFIRTFADKCHHAKEEDLLFVKMIEKGFPREMGPIGVMLHEHELGRSYVRAVDEALAAAGRGEEAARTRVRDGLLGYAQLLRAHIEKEDSILYPMADRAFSEQDQDELLTAFERVEREEMGEGVHEKYHRLAHELASA
jgi:hemerythrin-like domain-containing protein